MRLTRATTIVNRYRFELIIILVEFLVCLIVALTLLKLFAPEFGRVLAAEPQVTRRRPIKVMTVPPLITTQPDPIDPAGIYITVTELQPPATESVALDIPQNSRPDTVTTLAPLADWPVRGDISQGFGCSQFYTGIPGPDCPMTQPWFHDGLDLVAWLGAPVRAGLMGTVIFAGPDGDGPMCGDYHGYGLGVIVDTGSGWQALYAHLNEIKVSPGQQVGSDTLIGTVGETGCVTGPHLHFGLRYEGELVDPWFYLKE